MATWMYAGTSVRRTRERRAAQGHWRDGDERRPAFRLARPKPTARAYAQPHPSKLDLEEAPTSSTAPLPALRLRVIQLRPLTPYAVRLCACPYIENRRLARRCLAQEPVEVSLRCQAAVCLTQQHRRCPRYRQARGLRALPPQRLAAYTVALALVLLLIVVAGMQAARGDPGPSGSSDPSLMRK
jgi:hypothetical protein